MFMLKFMQNLIGVKFDKAAQAGVEALVRWDPKSASEAEMRTMEQHLDDLGREVAQARRSYDNENKEAEAIQILSQQRMSAAEQLQDKVEAETDPTRKVALEKSLETLVSMLETMAQEVDREKTEALDAKNFLEMLEQTYAEAGGKFTSARSALEQAQRDMGRAAQQREQADRQAESARRAAGLASSTSSLTVALKAMQDAASKDMVSADAQMSKARLLRPTALEKDDPNIAAALAQASGKPLLAQNLHERLLALKNV
jgi:chromosome segregation ATPase